MAVPTKGTYGSAAPELGHESALALAGLAATPACAVRGLQRPVPVWSSPANRRPTNMLYAVHRK